MDPMALISLHFEQLKELRNGSISYIQIIKRDQTRPPVRPVCRKLGVSKLSEIPTEADLYQALVAVSQAQAQKMRENGLGHLGMSNGGIEDDMMTPFNSARSDMSNGSDGFYGAPADFQEDYPSPRQYPSTLPQGIAKPRIDSAPSSLYGGNGEDRLESYPEYNALVKCILAIRTSWGPYKRTDLFSAEFGLPEHYLTTALSAVCELIGCRNLDPSIPSEVIVNAVNIFFRRSLSGGGGGSSARGSPRMPGSRPAPQRDPYGSVYGVQGTPPLPQYMQNQRSTLGGGHVAAAPASTGVYRSQSSEYSQPSPRDFGGSGYGQLDYGSAAGSRISSGRGVVTQPSIASSRFSGQYGDSAYQQQQQQQQSQPYGVGYGRGAGGSGGSDGIPSVMSSSGFSARAAPFTPASASLSALKPKPPSVPFSAPGLIAPGSGLTSSTSGGNQKQTSIMAAYQQFWETSYRLFKSIADSRRSGSESIDILAELSAIVLSTTPHSSILASALDMISQKAGQLLSEKVDFEKTDDLSRIAKSKPAEGLENCLGALTRLVSHTCRVIDPDLSISTDSLSSDLNELLFWSVSSNHASLPATTEDGLSGAGTSAAKELANKVEIALYSIAKNQISPFGYEEVYEHVRFRLESLLDSFQKGSAVHLHGASIIGLNDSTGFVDMTSLLPNVDLHEYESLPQRRDLARRIKTLESALMVELDVDTSILHIRECVKEVRVIVHNQVLRVKNLAGSSTNAEEANNHGRIASKLRADGEMMCKFGERYADTLQAEVDAARRQPQLRALIDQLSLLRVQLNDILGALEMSRNHALAQLESLLLQYRYSDVLISPTVTGLDFNLRFTDEDTPIGPVRCKLSIGRPLFVHSSRLLASYFGLDPTRKTLAVAAVVKAITKEHNVNQELSAYGWNVLIIHFLLRFGYLPAIQANFTPSLMSPAEKTLCGDIDVSYFDSMRLPTSCEDMLSQTSLLELMYQFFKYLSTEVDIFGSVITLRGHGEIMPKSLWGDIKTGNLWRIAIEDPFETTTSSCPRDLGAGISRQGQVKIFKVVRQCAFALGSLLKSVEGVGEETVFGLLSSELLLDLAVKGGYSETPCADKDKLSLSDGSLPSPPSTSSTSSSESIDLDDKPLSANEDGVTPPPPGFGMSAKSSPNSLPGSNDTSNKSIQYIRHSQVSSQLATRSEGVKGEGHSDDDDKYFDYSEVDPSSAGSSSPGRIGSGDGNPAGKKHPHVPSISISDLQGDPYPPLTPASSSSDGLTDLPSGDKGFAHIIDRMAAESLHLTFPSSTSRSQDSMAKTTPATSTDSTPRLGFGTDNMVLTGRGSTLRITPPGRPSSLFFGSNSQAVSDAIAEAEADSQDSEAEFADLAASLGTGGGGSVSASSRLNDWTGSSMFSNSAMLASLPDWNGSAFDSRLN